MDTTGIEQRAADQLRNYGWTALGEHKDHPFGCGEHT